MGKSAIGKSSEARQRIEDADRILGFALSKLMLEGPEDTLRQTSNTQPALFVASALALELLKEKGFSPSCTSGHSLGEYSALYAAGVLSFETALKLVRERGIAMQAAAEVSLGAMAAIIGLDEAKVVTICQEASSSTEACVPANFNTESQIVISGHRPAVERASEKAKAAGAMKVVMLNVSGAFHSPLMSEAVKKMTSSINQAQFSNATVPVYTNVDAAPTTNAQEFKTKLIQQIDHPVRWHDSLLKISQTSPDVYIEVGSGKVLGTMAKKIDRKKTVLFTDEWDAVEAFAASSSTASI